MKDKSEYSYKEDEALVEFLSLEEKNSSDSFVDYPVTQEFVSKSTQDFLNVMGFTAEKSNNYNKK